LLGNEECKDPNLIDLAKDSNFVDLIVLFFKGIEIDITKINKEDIEILFFIFTKNVL
jgi:hypothetical protein